MQKLFAPFTDKTILANLKAGDSILLSGTILTGRDAAHKRLCAMLDGGQNLPIELKGQAIYYTGPCPAPAGKPIGSCGPTTSGRMDAYAPRLLDLGLSAMIGKGQRSNEVINACMRNGAVYLAAAGGAAALLANCVKECKVIAFDDLGSEAIHLLRVEDMPLVVAVDTFGNDLYEMGRKQYKK